MGRIAHAAAALALVALAAACLIGLATPTGGIAAETASGAAKPACQTVLCMFAVN